MGRLQKWRPLYSPLERAWEMRLQCYKSMPDEAQALIPCLKLPAIYLYVPLHLFLLFPLALGPHLLLPSSLFQNPYLILHFPLLHINTICSFCLPYQMMRDRNVKPVISCGWHAYVQEIHPFLIAPVASCFFFPLFPLFTLFSFFLRLVVFFVIWEICASTGVSSRVRFLIKS